MKKIISFLVSVLIIVFAFSFGYAQKDIYPVDKIIGQSDDYVILATISAIEESNTIQLSKSYIISPKKVELPNMITVDNFKYSYELDQSKNYNNPKIGDNIIINLTKAGEKYMVGTGAYKVDTTYYSRLKVLIPRELQGTEKATQLLALAHYIRTDGEQNKFKYEKDNVLSLKDNTQLYDFEADYIAYNDIEEKSEKIDESLSEKTFADSKYFELIVIMSLIFLLGLGIFLIKFFSKKVIEK